MFRSLKKCTVYCCECTYKRIVVHSKQTSLNVAAMHPSKQVFDLCASSEWAVIQKRKLISFVCTTR